MPLRHCDRCKKKFEGDEHEGWTYGYYDVSSGYWAQFARPYETIICDDCMWCSPEYIALNGDFMCKGVKQSDL